MQSNLLKKKLIKLAKILKIRRYSKLNKNELSSLIKNHNAVNTIIKYYKNYLTNKVDSITFEKIKYPCFIWNVKGNYYYYNYESIINYIIKSGDTKDPMTRVEYSDYDLQRLDKEAKKNGYKFRSTFKIKNNSNYLKRIKRRANTIAAYELRINEILDSLKIALEANILILKEPIIVDDIQWRSPKEYVKTLVREIKNLLSLLNNLDPDLNDYYSKQLNQLII